MSDPVSNYNVDALMSEEQPDGTFADIDRIEDLYDIFHPLDGAPKTDKTQRASPTGYKINKIDLSDIFHPLAVSGKEVPKDTGLTVTNNNNETKDLSKIFARKNSLSVDLTLNQLPAGAFTCDTKFRAWYDTSGSMRTALSYIEPAVRTIVKFVKAVYGNDMVYSTSSKNEKCVDWIASALDSRSTTADPPKEVQIAFINESDSKGIGTQGAYHTRWKTVTDLGGTKYGAIGGVELPGHGFAGQIKRWLQSQADAHGDIGLSGFFNINNSTTSAEYVQMLVTWLNMPTQPSMLNTSVVAKNSGSSEFTVSWTCSDYICGLTHVPDNSQTIGYRKTQDHWKVEILRKHGANNRWVTLQEYTQNTRPEEIVYTPKNGEGNEFYCRVTAVAAAGYGSNKESSAMCLKANRAPTIQVNQDRVSGVPANSRKTSEINIGESWVDPGAYVYELDDLTTYEKISGTHNINFAQPGIYTVTYSYTDLDGSTASKTRSLKIVNIAPTLTLIGDKTIKIDNEYLKNQGTFQIAGPSGWNGQPQLFAYCDNWMNLYVNGVLKNGGLTWGGGQAGYFLQGIIMKPGDVVAMKCMDWGGTSNTYLNYISSYGWQWGTDGTWKMASSVPGGTTSRSTDTNSDWASPVYDDSSWSAATDLGMSGFAIATNFPSYTKHGRFIWDGHAGNTYITRWFRGVVKANYP